MRLIISAALLTGAAMALASCEADSGTGSGDNTDPLETQALNDQLMVDPDLANQNEAAAALSGNIDHSLPGVNMSRDAVVGALSDAAQLVGGLAAFENLPEPIDEEPVISLADSLTVAGLAAVTPGTDGCADTASYSAQWAARLPAALPVYQRGATQDAAGSDEEGCSLRAITFLTPVPLTDVLEFYYTRARKAGFDPAYRLRGDDHLLSGSKSDASFAVYGRSLASGVTEVDLITNGK